MGSLESCNKLQRRMRAQIDGYSGLILHRSKWRCLARSYELLLNSLDQRREEDANRSPESQLLAGAFNTLYEVMQAGERCLQDCTSSTRNSNDHKSWLLDKALVLGTSTEIVDLHLHDLLWCYFLVEKAFACPRLADILKQVMTRLHEIWEDEREEEDLASTLGFLDRLRADGAESEMTNSMADFLSLRLAGASMLEGEGPDRHDLPAYFWVHPEELKAGIPKIIGGGAYGVIFEAEWRGGRFAVKQSLCVQEDDVAFSDEGYSVDQLEREAVIQARLRHPNVIHLVCCSKIDKDRKRCGLVMELMHKDLHSLLLKRKPQPFSHLVAVDLMLQIAKGMEYLHGLGIMHRDLKPANILASFPTGKPDFNKKFHLKIADFGEAKAKLPGSDYSTKVRGTAQWRAPEVFEDEVEFRNYTSKADVYSFGLICYAVLTGKVPFEGVAATEVGKRVRWGHRPELPGDCPIALATYIRKCWHHHPSVRPSFSQICRMLRYLKACLLIDESWTAHGRFDTMENKLMETMSSYGIQYYSAKISDLHRRRWQPLISIPLEMYIYSKMLGIPVNQWSPLQMARIKTKEFCREAYKKIKRLHKCMVFEGGLSGDDESMSIHEERPHDATGDHESQLGLNAGIGREFTDQELLEAMRNFQQKITDAGEFKNAYWRGCLHDGTEITVKTISCELTGPVDDRHHELAAKLRILCRIQHNNLVPVLGWSQQPESNKLRLVYEYMPNGNLEHIILNHGPSAASHQLPWERRYRLVIQLAAALKYLHHESGIIDGGIVHGDVRPCNIMLDSEWKARLECSIYKSADLFYHNTQLEDSATNIAKLEVEAFVAPELLISGEATPASDVHSFGVTVLVLACGRSAVMRLLKSGAESHTVREWVWQSMLYESNTDEDVKMVDETQLRRLLVLGLRCSNADPDARPTMAEVLDQLQSTTY